MIGKTTDPFLQKTEQAVQAKVPQAMQPSFQRALQAGLTIMYTPKMQQRMMTAIQGLTDPANGAARGAANILGILFKQSKGSMPMQIGVPVAMSLMCEFLDLMEKSGKGQITPELVGQATQDTSQAVMQLFGIDQNKLHQVVGAGMQAHHALNGDPNAAPAPAQAQAAAQPQAQPSGGIIGSAMGAQ
jgi:hypothetical protein